MRPAAGPSHPLALEVAAAEAAQAGGGACPKRCTSARWRCSGKPRRIGDRKPTRRPTRSSSPVCGSSFPDDAICAEESPTNKAAGGAAAAAAGFVDPLDGTREFIGKSGEFCVMVGLAVAGRPVLGVVVAPVWQRTFRRRRRTRCVEITAGTGARACVGRGRAADARVVLSRLHKNATVDAAVSAWESATSGSAAARDSKFMLVAAGGRSVVHTGKLPTELWDGCALKRLPLPPGPWSPMKRGMKLAATIRIIFGLDGGIIVRTRDWAAGSGSEKRQPPRQTGGCGLTATTLFEGDG